MTGEALDVLHRLFYPRAAAVVGSTAEGKLGYHLLRQIVSGGYERIYAVNPKAQGLGHVPGFPSLTAVPEPVDVAVIASPAATVADVLEDCGRAGVGVAVVITAGFSEVGNATGEAEIVRVARRHGIRLVGPNCAGLLNTAHRFCPTLEVIPPAGATALVSQSGALGGAILSWAEEQGLGFSKFVSYGNGADLDEAAFLRYLADDDDTRAVALYIESIADGREFMAALEACTRRKPVVVIKAGRTAAGQRAALSHTGSMAGSDAVYDAALRQCGALRVKTVEEMFDLCKGFVSLPPVRGRRLVIVTNCGGPGVLAADQAEEVGLSLPEPGPDLRARLSALLPPYCSLRNPIDLTVEGTESAYREALRLALESGEYDAALALNVNPAYLDSGPLARGVADAMASAGRPVAATFMAGRAARPAVAHFRSRGIPVYPTGERAVSVLARMAGYHEWQQASAARPPVGGGRSALGRTPSTSGLRALAGARGVVLEPDAMAWLREKGYPVPEFRVARTRAEAVSACREVGYPAVMKVVSPEILHKSDVGGVVADIRDDASAEAAFEQITRAAAGRELRGVVVYPMVRGAREVLVGLTRDPQFGPVVAFGLGGIYTEVLRDVSLRVAPVDEAGALAMIGEIRGAPLLRGVRGEPPADITALARLIRDVSHLPDSHADLAELDLNPVFVLREGVTIGDARIVTC